MMSSLWMYFIVQVPVGCLGRDDLYAAGNTDVELCRVLSWRQIQGTSSILALMVATYEVYTYNLKKLIIMPKNMQYEKSRITYEVTSSGFVLGPATIQAVGLGKFT